MTSDFVVPEKLLRFRAPCSSRYQTTPPQRPSVLLNALPLVRISRCDISVRSVIHHGKEPVDVRIAVYVGEHTADRQAALVNLPGSPDLEGEKSHLADAVTVVAQSVIHPGVAHESPYHDFLSL